MSDLPATNNPMLPTFEEECTPSVLTEGGMSIETMDDLGSFLHGIKTYKVFPVLDKTETEVDKKGTVSVMSGSDGIPNREGKANVSFITVAILSLREARALWHPEMGVSKMPICRTSLMDPRDIGEAYGQWDLQSAFAPPEGCDASGRVKCSTCKWNQFGSASEWKSKEGLKSKACGDTMPYMLMPMKKEGVIPGQQFEGEDIHYYSPDPEWLHHPLLNPHGLLLAQLSLSSDKPAVDAMQQAIIKYGARAKHPLQSIVFKIYCMTMGGAGLKYASYRATPCGVTGSPGRVQYLVDRAPEALHWLMSNLSFVQSTTAPKEGDAF